MDNKVNEITPEEQVMPAAKEQAGRKRRNNCFYDFHPNINEVWWNMSKEGATTGIVGFADDY